MKIGFVLSHSPHTEPHAATLTRLAKAAVDAGATVTIFCTLDGVYARFDGMDVVYDSESLRQRGLPGPGGTLASILPVDRLVTL